MSNTFDKPREYVGLASDNPAPAQVTALPGAPQEIEEVGIDGQKKKKNEASLAELLEEKNRFDEIQARINRGDFSAYNQFKNSASRDRGTILAEGELDDVRGKPGKTVSLLLVEDWIKNGRSEEQIMAAEKKHFEELFPGKKAEFRIVKDVAGQRHVAIMSEFDVDTIIAASKYQYQRKATEKQLATAMQIAEAKIEPPSDPIQTKPDTALPEAAMAAAAAAGKGSNIPAQSAVTTSTPTAPAVMRAQNALTTSTAPQRDR